jgi:hypothetical protein
MKLTLELNEAQQRRLAEIADRSNFLSFIGSGLEGGANATLERHAVQHIGAIDEKLQAFLSDLQTMRLQVVKAREARPTVTGRVSSKVSRPSGSSRRP